jgi:hypothetical protein
MTRNEFDPTAYSAHELLRQYADILRELRKRRIIRTANAPAGDLAETLVARAYSGMLAPNSEKSWDVTAADGRLLQVKSRVIAANASSKPIQFSVFRSWEFDTAVFVVLTAETYDVLRALEVPSQSVHDRANATAWVGGHTIMLSLLGLAALPGCADVTARVQSALEHLDLSAG